MSSELSDIPGVSSLTGCAVHAVETDAGERGYLIRLGTPGEPVDLLASVVELENLRQQIEKATVTGMWGTIDG